MRWIRSYPATIPAGRAFVIDALPRLGLTDYDYTPLGAIDDDICLLEWDMAASAEDIATFTEHARARPNAVCVAPYRLYRPSVAEAPTAGVWAHRRVTDEPLFASGARPGERWVFEGEPEADYVGFGLIYLPRDLIRAFLSAAAPERGRPMNVPIGEYADKRFTDSTFSAWHHRQGYGPVPITWAVRPVHLHF